MNFQEKTINLIYDKYDINKNDGKNSHSIIIIIVVVVVVDDDDVVDVIVIIVVLKYNY